MALGDNYIDATALKAYLRIDDTTDDTLLTSACTTSTLWINQFCDRQFQRTTTASARSFHARDGRTVYVTDFHTTTDLVVKTDTSDDGTFATTWTTADYVLEPLDGIAAGMTGQPYYKIRAVGAYTFPRCRRPGVQVTAQWGWTAVPEPVTAAAKIVAAYVFNLKDSPMGVISTADGGAMRVAREIPQAATLLGPYLNPATTGPLVA